MTDQHVSDTHFASFDLPDPVRQGLTDAGFTHCTPIQGLALPPALEGKDVAGQAQTGTGKTAAFLITVFTHLLRHPAPEQRRPNQVRALILAPTRELAIQIHKDAMVLGSHTGLTLGLAYGGTDYEKQRKQLSDGVDILIGTPGRIIDYFKQKVFDLRQAQTLVLDEADRMFDLGFIKDVRFLLRRMPPPTERQSMLFSATLSWRVMELAYEHMNNPAKVQTQDEQVTAERVRQAIYYPANDQKIPLLLGLMRKLGPERSMVFVNTKHGAEKVTAWLEGNNIRVALLSGDVPQRKRQSLLAKFEQSEYQVLVATDVAARGLHIPDVSHVFNFDLPQSGEDYVHRIGRTGRAGAEGDAISFACEDFAFHLPEIEEYIGFKIDSEMTDHAILATDLEPPKRRQRKPSSGPPRGRSGGRSGSSSGPGKQPRARQRSDQESTAGSQAAKPQGEPSGEDNGKPPRRRRRRKPRQEGPATPS
ncbi:ATP-dependent RNA helicase RhlB [Ectothiorhodospira variabilis]|uniref:ATP-dependent RNA helicase RhlB n=1 Tax=Ectothiorhodospira variabilis TaxID=505694 RepID=UPI001EFB2764|nr:ATP-dependent RNA helicase RhlB [Ectothiorhodospira variabilis]MCG5494419.1 ATP-dependent RNA helicase RhlB [Ectothiorhodospira variabilis]MCG5498980.1 ATP-dependent RNA helicase RhlB [Ectothiorhodospira variabilis]MCG5503210.1 ATP-dependent RNA helicase RhlB [Ectothiorhodospira variabilis]MCG5506031.1 ATP-dependent RNA helicase RhlB [Ectothiorhodospira variabilis]